ncbi:MAG: hypothetical protein ACM3NH_01205 [Candidatus Saccharibacteria bacterium]
MAKNNPVSATVNDQQENRQVRKDLVFVVVMNLIFFAVLIGLFFWNRSTQGLDHFFGKILKF